MNLKLVLAAALFVSTGTFVAQAQNKTSTTKVTAVSSTAKAFQTKVNAYKAEKDADKAATQFRALSVDMSNELGKAKAGFATATTDAEKKAVADKYETRQSSLNQATSLFNANASTNKDAIVEALNKFAKTL